jgi:hypothetical protein
VPSNIGGKQRWEKIAEGVEGKTSQECYDRFSLKTKKKK